MMKYKSLSSLSKVELVNETKKLVEKEREVTLQLIEHLAEIDERRLHLELGYGSLFEFCVKHLGLSEGSTQRRLDSMRLMKALPEVKESLQSGALSLSNASSVQRFFRQEKKQGLHRAPSEKLRLIQSLTHTSKKDCEKTLAALNPELASSQKESIKPIDTQWSEVKFWLQSSFCEQELKEWQALRSHQFPVLKLAEAFQFLIQKDLKELRDKKYGKPSPALQSPPPAAVNPPPQKPTPPKPRTRLIPTQTRRAIWQRDQGRCRYQHPKTQTRCTSRYRLEIHHLKPYGLGGSHDPQNLELRCQAHNLYQAIRDYGELRIFDPTKRSLAV